MATQIGEDRIIDHRTLLHAARKLYVVAALGEADLLASASEEFLSELESHVRDEARTFVSLAPGEARLLERGQSRIVTLARMLRERAASRCGEPAQCRELAEELLARCFLQVRDEGSSLRGDPALGTDIEARSGASSMTPAVP